MAKVIMPGCQPAEELLRESVPIPARDLQHLDVVPPLQLIGECVPVRVHRGDDCGVGVKELPNRVAEPLRGKLHLAQLVDHQHAAYRDILERGAPRAGGAARSALVGAHVLSGCAHMGFDRACSSSLEAAGVSSGSASRAKTRKK
jgi:hypothetical protein